MNATGQPQSGEGEFADTAEERRNRFLKERVPGLLDGLVEIKL